MKTFTKSMLFLLMLGFTTVNLYSQSPIKTQPQSKEQSPYEQRIRALFKKFLMDIGFDYTIAQKASQDDNYANSIVPQISQKMESNSLRSLGLWNQLEADREDAKKLMNSIEKERDRIETQTKQKVIQTDISQTEYLQSDANNLQRIIHDKYTKWSAKGDYEKTSDYQQRMEGKQAAIRNIIITSIQDYVQFMNIVGNSSGDKFRIQCYLGDYNPDNETLELIFRNKNGTQWNGNIKVTPDKAQKLKSGARTTTIDDISLSYNYTLQVEQDKCSLGFHNNNLLSTKFKIKHKNYNGSGNSPFEYLDVTMTSPPQINFGKQFFTSANLQIDMTGNENFTFNDVTLACKEIENK